jgi:predicted dehydrogenase
MKSPKQTKTRVGLIGCGGIVHRFHLPQILENRHAQLAAVADPSSDRVEELFAKARVRCASYFDYRQMIRDAELDAVIISTPHSLHYEQARLALEHNLHVLIEKPLAIRSSHAARLTTLAEAHSRILVVAYQRFFQEKSVYARELIATGQIGEIRGVAAHITQSWENVTGWRADPAVSGGGFLMDTGSHLVSTVLRITGLTPVAIRATIENRGKPVDISSILTVEFGNGALGSLSFFGDAKLYEESVTIHGTKGCIELATSHGPPRPLLLNNEPVAIPKRIKASSPGASFIAWIRNGGEGYAPPSVEVDTVRLTEAAYRSARDGKRVRLSVTESKRGKPGRVRAR